MSYFDYLYKEQTGPSYLELKHFNEVHNSVLLIGGYTHLVMQGNQIICHAKGYSVAASMVKNNKSRNFKIVRIRPKIVIDTQESISYIGDVQNTNPCERK